jgi:hypothetical protein
MAGITMQAELATLDMSDFEKVTTAFMRQEMVKAVQAFLRACLVRIPQRTGFLRGSFTDIAQFFKVSGTGAGNSGYATKPEYYYHTPGSRTLKKPLYGTRFATPPSKVLRRVGDQVVFTIDSEIKYFARNDFKGGIPSAPWNSLKEGLAAMTNYLEGSPNRFPRIEAIFGTMTIRTQGTSTSTSKQRPNVDAILTTRELLIEGF